MSFPANNQKPVIITPLDSVLTEAEADLFSKHRPYGFILFGKHCENPDQVKALVKALKDSAGNDCIISIDQEGGRVARMREPQWQNFPTAADMNDPYETYKQLGTMLKDEGIDVNFAPCLDVVPQGCRADAIGDRCFSSDPEICGLKGVDACRGLLDSGIVPVIKHMPGHGRAVEDSHYHLPVVNALQKDLLKDLEAFKTIVKSGLPVAGMTCHVIYECWDKYNPATLSKTVINDIIRDEIGFTGLLFSDDLVMKALDSYGDMITRVHSSLNAGCDVAMPCHTTLDQTQIILESL